MTKRLDPESMPTMFQEATNIVEYGISAGLDTLAKTLRAHGRTPGSVVSLWMAALLFEASVRPAVRREVHVDDMNALIRLAKETGSAIAEDVLGRVGDRRSEPTTEDAAEAVLRGMDSIREVLDSATRAANEEKR